MDNYFHCDGNQYIDHYGQCYNSYDDYYVYLKKTFPKKYTKKRKDPNLHDEKKYFYFNGKHYIDRDDLCFDDIDDYCVHLHTMETNQNKLDMVDMYNKKTGALCTLEQLRNAVENKLDAMWNTQTGPVKHRNYENDKDSFYLQNAIVDFNSGDLDVNRFLTSNNSTRSRE